MTTNRRAAKRGEVAEFISIAAAYDGEECLPWPFRRNPENYGSGIRTTAPREVLEARLGPPPQDGTIYHCAHSCRNPICVNPKHLRWATPKENEGDKVGHGTAVFGEESPKAKLTEQQVAEIISAPQTETYKSIASRYGVSRSAVGVIRRATRWKHVKPTGDGVRMRIEPVRLPERNPNARLTREDVESLRRDYNAGIRDQNLADKYGISRTHAWSIASGRAWKI